MSTLPASLLVIGYFSLTGYIVYALFSSGHPVWATIIGFVAAISLEIRERA